MIWYQSPELLIYQIWYQSVTRFASLVGMPPLYGHPR